MQTESARMTTAEEARYRINYPNSSPRAVKVVALDPPAQGSSKGCATAPADALAAILAEPSSYYVNVHTAKYPEGAMRGQLGR